MGLMIAIIAAQGFIFMFLILVLRHFMKSNVTGAVGHLQKANDDLMKQQSSLKAKIAESEKEYRDKMAKLNQEIAEKQAGVRKEVNETLEEAKQGALKEKERIINEAVDTRERMKREVMAEMEEKAIQHSQALIAEFFSGELKKLMHDSLVKDVLEGLKDVDLSQFQIQSDTAELIAAEAIDEKIKNEMKTILEKKINQSIQFKDQVDESLVGGVILKFGTFVIDGSLSNHLKDAASKMKRTTAKRYQKAV